MPNPDCNYCVSKTCFPTLKAPEDFSARRDRLQLYISVGGAGYVRDTMIDILTQRSDQQRQMIAEDYIRTGSTLLDDIPSGNSGKFTRLMKALVKPLPVFYASELHEALEFGYDGTLIEILTSLPGCAIREISVVFRMVYGVSLTNKIAEKTWFNFKELMLNLAKGDRDEHEIVSTDQVKGDAEDLVNAGMGAWMAGHSKFVEVFTKRSCEQLQATINAYNELRKSQDSNFKSIIDDVNSFTFFSANFKSSIAAIISNCIDQQTYFANELETALSGYFFASDTSKLSRIIRGRFEIDLEGIKRIFEEIYGVSLASRIKAQTYTDYQKALLAMVGE